MPPLIADLHAQPEVPELSVQERVLGGVMHQHLGRLAIAYEHTGVRKEHRPENVLDPKDYPELARDFARDPKSSLAFARHALIEIGRDQTLTDESRRSRLGRYMDAYFDLTLKLEHDTFPNTPAGQVVKGIPEYLPDGFHDLGSERYRDPRIRGREMIHVDKAEIFKKYRGFFLDIYSQKYGEVDSDETKRMIVSKVANMVYKSLPYSMPELSGDKKVSISKLETAVCRHHAMTTQVLLQAFGITSKLFKNDFESDNRMLGAHGCNLVRINGQWHVIDSTNPIAQKQDGSYAFGFPIGPQAPKDGERVELNPGSPIRQRAYRAHSQMYGFVER